MDRVRSVAARKVMTERRSDRRTFRLAAVRPQPAPASQQQSSQPRQPTTRAADRILLGRYSSGASTKAPSSPGVRVR